MRAAFVFSLATLSSLGCGSKTSLTVDGLEAPPGDGAVDARDSRPPTDTAPADTAPPPRPDCFDALEPGAIRGVIEDIDGRAAYDDVGNLYAPRLAEGDWFLVSYDPCLTLRWVVPFVDFDGRRRRVRTSVDADGFIWLKGRFDVERVTTDGLPSPPMLEVEGQVWTWLGVPPDGPVYASVNGTDMPRFLYRTRAGGGADRVQLEEVSSYVWDDECLIADGGALCWNVAYDLADLRLRYYRDPPRLIDGTLRNITQPAFDGERLWTLRFGVSTYDVVAISPRTGEELARAPLARTTRGQTDTIISPPVIGPGGEVIVYFTGHRGTGTRGQLQAFDRNAAALWSYEAARTFRSSGSGIFGVDSIIALGDANVAYLAVGESVHAVVASSGMPRWSVSVGVDLNDPDLSISPLGDLVMLDDDRTLHIMATESRAVARTPWPVAGGGPRNAYAR